MQRSCPTITELLAFDAVSRYGSITLAAQALCASVSSVSKQMASLEASVGKPLISKSGRGIVLTPLGRAYWAKISPSLRNIEAATYEARAGEVAAGILTLASVPTFLTKWLIPRLAAFRQGSPDVTFSFCRHIGMNERHPPDIDAAIRYGEGDWPDVQADYIAGCEFVCVAAPELLQNVPDADDPACLIAQTLLHHDEAPQAWPGWAASRGVNPARTFAGPRFAQYSMLIQAALSGLGIGLVPYILIENELQESRLTPLGEPISLSQGHYLCYLAEKLDRPVFAAFREWLLKEGKSTRIRPRNERPPGG